MEREVKPLFIDWKEKQKLLEENRKLKLKLSELGNELRRYEQEKRLQEKHKFLFPLPEGKCLYVPVLFRPLENYYDFLVLGYGKKKGLKPGMPLLREDGLVGQVSQVFQNYAFGKLITSPDLIGGVYNARTRQVGVMQGARGKGVEVRFFPSTSSVSVGDIFLTSSLSTFFFRGIPVGRVREIKKNKDTVTLKIYLDPIVDLNRIQWVCGYVLSS